MYKSFLNVRFCLLMFLNFPKIIEENKPCRKSILKSFLKICFTLWNNSTSFVKSLAPVCIIWPLGLFITRSSSLSIILSLVILWKLFTFTLCLTSNLFLQYHSILNHLLPQLSFLLPLFLFNRCCSHFCWVR